MAFPQLFYRHGYTFSKGKDRVPSLYTMIVKYSSLVCNRPVAKSHKAVQCDRCNCCVSFSYLHFYTYRQLQKDKLYGMVCAVLKRNFQSAL